MLTLLYLKFQYLAKGTEQFGSLEHWDRGFESVLRYLVLVWIILAISRSLI